MSIVDQLVHMLDRMHDEGRKPARVLVGNLDAAEFEAEIMAVECWRDRAPGFLVDMKYPTTVLGVPVERVDQPRLLGVVAEGFERRQVETTPT